MSPDEHPGLFDTNDDPPSPGPAPRTAPTAATAFTGLPVDVLPADLARLLAADPTAESGRELVGLVVAAERLAGWAQARSSELMAALAVPGVPGPTEQLGRRILHPEADPEEQATEDEISAAMEWEAAQRLAADQLAAVLVQSPITMRIRVNQAQSLVHDFRITHTALAQGRLCRSKAAVVLDRLQFVADPQVRQRLEERAAEAAGGRAPGRLGALLDRWVVAADPDAAERRRKAARVARKVTHRALADGMGRLAADLPADSSRAIHDLLTEAGRVTQGLAADDDRRTLDQCRADLLSDIMLTLAAGETVSLAMLLDAAGRVDPGSEAAAEDDRVAGMSAAAEDLDSSVRESPDCGVSTAEDAAAAGAGDSAESAGDGSDHAADGSAVQDARVPEAESTEPRPEAEHSGGSRTADSGRGTEGAGTPAQDVRDPWIPEPWTAETLGLPSFSLPKRQGRPLHTVITMTLDTFAWLSRDPATLAGYGAITAEWAQILVEAARSVSLLITDEHGQALDASAYVYRPRQQVRDQVMTMNPTCIFTTCNRPAYDCEFDHRQRFLLDHPAAGGLTTKENLEPLCRRHHQAKTHGGWRNDPHPGGSRTFVSPLGTRTVSPPADHPMGETPVVDPPF